MIFLNEAILRISLGILNLAYSIFFFQSSRRGSAGRSLAYSEFFFSLWTLFDGIECLLSKSDDIVVIQSFIFLSAECATYFLYFFARRLSVPKNQTKHTRMYFLSIMPIIMVVSCIISIIFTNSSIFVKLPDQPFSEGMLSGYKFSKKPMYYIHSVYSYTLIVLAVISFIYNSFKSFKHHKRLFLMGILGLVIFLIPELYKFVIQNFIPDRYGDFNFVIVALSKFSASTIFFFAFYFLESELNLRYFNEQSFTNARNPIFIFTKNNEYIETNDTGVEFFKKYSLNPDIYTNFDKIFSTDKFIKLGIPGVENPELDFYLKNIDTGDIFLCSIVRLYNKRKIISGYYLFLTKIEIFANIVTQLEQSAYNDELTGCKRRSLFEQSIFKKYGSMREPVCIICAKISDLAVSNKKIGYKKTDSFIIKFSEILKKNLTSTQELIDEKVEIFRMDGSTFSFVLPIAFENQLPALFKSIKSECNHLSKNSENKISCMLGYSVIQNCTGIAKGLDKSFENMQLN